MKEKIRESFLWLLALIVLFSAFMLIARSATASVRQAQTGMTVLAEDAPAETEVLTFTLFFPKSGGVLVHFLDDGSKLFLQEEELPDPLRKKGMKKAYGRKIFESNSPNPIIQKLLYKLDMLD